MKVKDVMTETPHYCQPETNLGSATELMWNADCGFLPVRSADGKVVGGKSAATTRHYKERYPCRGSLDR